MTLRLPTRRQVLLGGGAALTLPRVALGAPPVIRATKAKAQILPADYPPTEVWSYDGLLPGPELRLPQGARLARRFVNDLDVPSSIHWHGIRIDNAMDGVAGLTQDPVPPGGSFDYDFAVPDAGTYWYHAHTMSMEQVARGLSGPLVVTEAEPPDVDGDKVLMLDDWLVDPETGQLDPDFSNPMTLSHGGRTGNLVGVNGQYGFRFGAARGERWRLRLVNAANARIFVLRLAGAKGWTMALDGMPMPRAEALGDALVLAPAQRVDLFVDMPAEGEVALETLGGDQSWRELVSIDLGAGGPPRRDAPPPLPPNPRMDLPALENARHLDMHIEGGAMGRMPMDQMRSLMQGGSYWMLGGQAGLGDAPFAAIARGETIRISLVNDTAFPHAMHLHGMHFREVLGAELGPMRDTILTPAGETQEIAFVADNPGKWLLHCHMLAHAATGMIRWIEVA